MFNNIRLKKTPYVSCIKINGVPILPPLITNEERQLLFQYKFEAVAIENRIKHDSTYELHNFSCPNCEHTTINAPNELRTLCQNFDVTSSRSDVPKLSSSPCSSPKCNRLKKILKKPVSPIGKKKSHTNGLPVEIATPRKQAIRKNSYTLESPTPEILEHLCALQNKNDKRLSLAGQEEDLDYLLKLEKLKCLKNLNQMNLQIEGSCINGSQDEQEKIFMDNLPENFFQVNRNVLSESKSDLYENKLTSSIHLASDLLNSIKTNHTRTSPSNTNTNEEAGAPTSLNDPSEDVFASQLNVRRGTSQTFHSTVTNFVLPQVSNARKCSATAMPYHRHRRVWNLKQAKHLWENEELTFPFPDRDCHSEPTSRRTSPLPMCKQGMSCSLNCLGGDETVDEVSPSNSYAPLQSCTDENLQQPMVCLERGLDTVGTSTIEEDLNLYSYYLNLFKGMSEYVSHEGELVCLQEMPPDPQISAQSSLQQTKTLQLLSDNKASCGYEEAHADSQSNESVLSNFNTGLITHTSDTILINSNTVSQASSKTSLNNSNKALTISHASRDSSLDNPNNTVSAPRHTELSFTDHNDGNVVNMELHDSLDVDIERFLLDLQRSQKEEMSSLLRKQKDEQRWLRQRQEKLKENVLCLSSRASSVHSSLTPSLDQNNILDVLNTGEINKEKGGKSNPQAINCQVANDCNRVINETGEFNDVFATGSNKSTPSHYYNSSCEEWFTPEMDKLSPLSDKPLDVNQMNHFKGTDLLIKENASPENPTSTLESTEHVSTRTDENPLFNVEFEQMLSASPSSQYYGSHWGNTTGCVSGGAERMDLSSTFTKEDDVDLISWRDTENQHNWRSQRNGSIKSTGILKDIVNIVQHSDHVESPKFDSLKDSAILRFVDVCQSAQEDKVRGQSEEIGRIQQDLELMCQDPIRDRSSSVELRKEEPPDRPWRLWEEALRDSTLTNNFPKQEATENATSNNKAVRSSRESSMTTPTVDFFPHTPTKIIDIPDTEEVSKCSHLLGGADSPHFHNMSSKTDQVNTTLPSDQVNTTLPSDFCDLFQPESNQPYSTSDSQDDNPVVSGSQNVDPAKSTHSSLPSEKSFLSTETPAFLAAVSTETSSVSLDFLKQKYLLRPTSMTRGQGLHEFETNVVRRLHREASERPKSLIRESYSEKEKQAALTLTAAGRGFLVRRLLRTARVMHIKATIQDTLKCALSLQSDPACVLSARDLELHTRLIQQLTAACYELYDTFFSLSIKEQCSLIAQDREQSRLRAVKLAALTNRTSLPTDLTRTKRTTHTKPASEPRSNNDAATVKHEKKIASKVQRSKSVSSQDVANSRSSESMSSTRSYMVSRSQSNTLDSKSHSVPIRRRLALI